MNPVILEETQEDEASFGIYSQLIHDRMLFLSEEIDAEVATTLVAILFWLEKQNPDEEIKLYINSSGGTVCDGLLTIYDTLQVIQAPVRTICIGQAYSSAAMLLAAGTPGRRLAYPNAKIMIHSIQVSDISGSQPEITREVKRIKDLNDSIMEILARHTGQSLKKVKRDCQTDKFLSAAEALRYGFIDEIVKFHKNVPPLTQ